MARETGPIVEDALVSAPLIVSPPYPTPPLGLKWGFGRGFDTKISPHHGAFDISERRPTIWGI